MTQVKHGTRKNNDDAKAGEHGDKGVVGATGARARRACRAPPAASASNASRAPAGLLVRGAPLVRPVRPVRRASVARRGCRTGGSSGRPKASYASCTSPTHARAIALTTPQILASSARPLPSGNLSICCNRRPLIRWAIHMRPMGIEPTIHELKECGCAVNEPALAVQSGIPCVMYGIHVHGKTDLGDR